MRVAVKNNSLTEAIKVLGAQRAGLIMADLVSNLPSVIFGKPLDEFGISISYNIGQILIRIDVIYPEMEITPTVKSDMELNAAMDSIILKILPYFIDTLKPPTATSTVDSKSEYEEGTLHRRMLDI